MIKQVIVVRTDLNMRKGKLAAQVAHASMKVFFDRMTNMQSYWNVEKAYACDFTNEMIEWKEGSFAKIVVGCNSEQELFDLQKQAEEAGIVNAIILDNGNTEFKTYHCPICGNENVTKFEDFSRVNTSLDVRRYRCNNCTLEFELDGLVVKNKPTYTCLAIGPDESDRIDKITGKLKLL